MWPFKKKARTSATALIPEIVNATELKVFEGEVDNIQVVLLQHVLLLLAVRHLPVSPAWEGAIAKSLSTHCDEHDPENKLRLGLALYQYPFDENPFDEGSFYGKDNSVCRPILKAIEYFYKTNGLQPDRLQVLLQTVTCTQVLTAAANLFTVIEKEMNVVA
jgi:hypothetical protein